MTGEQPMPNSKGPARVQMPSTASGPIPEAEIKPEDIGVLSVRYVKGHPVIVVNGGSVLLAELPVVDATGNAVTTYSATNGTRTLGNGYQVWNSNIANLLDVATNAWSTEDHVLFLDR
ncbi:hypothetical protein [Streptomyces mirabilis]|uniref:hypothetical protein n=1 Tax=Streptomyces mirabilis TaxID=68239 RepID=UPI0033299E13